MSQPDSPKLGIEAAPNIERRVQKSVNLFASRHRLSDSTRRLDDIYPHSCSILWRLDIQTISFQFVRIIETETPNTQSTMIEFKFKFSPDWGVGTSQIIAVILDFHQKSIRIILHSPPLSIIRRKWDSSSFFCTDLQHLFFRVSSGARRVQFSVFQRRFFLLSVREKHSSGMIISDH